MEIMPNTVTEICEVLYKYVPPRGMQFNRQMEKGRQRKPSRPGSVSVGLPKIESLGSLIGFPKSYIF